MIVRDGWERTFPRLRYHLLRYGTGCGVTQGTIEVLLTYLSLRFPPQPHRNHLVHYNTDTMRRHRWYIDYRSSAYRLASCHTAYLHIRSIENVVDLMLGSSKSYARCLISSRFRMTDYVSKGSADLEARYCEHAATIQKCIFVNQWLSCQMCQPSDNIPSILIRHPWTSQVLIKCTVSP